ncbi:MAG TPA: type II toxin-antitoxin system VapC family toxin [Rhizomicrobium sp.]|jgi:hypothetical protein|nr:type II toxin-antitoxin system VapC family toxin [Rhizomicrobium sp.]
MIIVDTNVLSETTRLQPSPALVRWMRLTPRSELFTTAITEAEMRYGAAKPIESRRKRELETLIEYIFSVTFAGRILPFDSDAAKAFAPFVVGMERDGQTYSQSDAQIIAIARVHGAAIATRDAGFGHSGVPLIDPWKS